MNVKTASSIMADVLNETYTYLGAGHKDSGLEIIRNKLLSLSGLETFDFDLLKGKNYSYEDIQEVLSTLKEKESIRRSKGVYYTPADVVRFIIGNSVRSAYGKLGTKGFQTAEPSGIPYRSFCMTKSVFDPTCGAGEFLLAALETKFDLLDDHVKNVTGEMISNIVSTVYGNDIDKESTAIYKIRLFLCAVRRYGLRRCSSIDKILNRNFYNKDFISDISEPGRRFDIIIGNPPYVEDGKSGLSLTKKYGNIYANVLDNSARLLNDNGSIGFVIPLSYVSTPRMKAIRKELFLNIPEQYIFSYSDRPDCLFKSVHQKLCILIGKKRKGGKRIFTGNYQYWYKEERESLFEQTSAVKNDFAAEDYIPKLGTPADVEVYKKVRPAGERIKLTELSGIGEESVYVNMRAAFWIKAFRQEHTGSEYKRFTFRNAGAADYFSCIVNSSLFWWYWICVSDYWHITNKELHGFTVPQLSDFSTASRLAAALENRLEETKLYVGTKQTEYEYKHRCCVDEIHAIDDFVNGLYGLTEEESGYIKSFAHRYRVSGGAELTLFLKAGSESRKVQTAVSAERKKL